MRRKTIIQCGLFKTTNRKLAEMYPENQPASVIVKGADRSITAPCRSPLEHDVHTLVQDGFRLGCDGMLTGFVHQTGHFSKAEKDKEKDAKRREDRERSDGHEAKHNSSEKDRRKDEKKRKGRDLSQDRNIPIKR